VASHQSCSLGTCGSCPSSSWAINCQQKVISSPWAKAPTARPTPLESPHADPTPVSLVPCHQHPAHPRGIAAAASPLTHGTSASAAAQPARPRRRQRPGHTACLRGQPAARGRCHRGGTRLRQGWAPGGRCGQDGACWMLRSCRHRAPSSFTSPSSSSHAHQHQCPQPGRAAGHSPGAPCPQPQHRRTQSRGQIPLFQGRTPLATPRAGLPIGSGGRWMVLSPVTDHPSPSIWRVPSTPAPRTRGFPPPNLPPHVPGLLTVEHSPRGSQHRLSRPRIRAHLAPSGGPAVSVCLSPIWAARAVGADDARSLLTLHP